MKYEKIEKEKEKKNVVVDESSWNLQNQQQIERCTLQKNSDD